MNAELPHHWDYEYDVVVIGGGNTGLPAAIVAHDANVSTVIVEQNDFLGGLMRASGGFMFFCKSHVQERNGIHDEVEWGIDDEMWMSEFRAVPEIVRAYVERSGETCKWLEDLGLTWSDELRDGDMDKVPGRNRAVARTHYAAVSPTGYYPGGWPEGQMGYALTTVLAKAVEARGIPVLYGHRMRRIFREPGGPVVGIEAETADGTVTIRARRGVVLASGGATTNEAIVKSWDRRYVGDTIFSDGLPYMTAMGDAFVAGAEVGGGLADLGFFSYLPIKYGSHYYSLSVSAALGEPNISPVTGVPIIARRGGYRRVVLLHGDGRRYIDESIAARDNPDLIRDIQNLPPNEYPDEPFFRKYLELPNPRNVWAVTDAASAAAMKWPIDEIVDPDPMHGRALHPDSVAVADTIPELAARIGMAPELVAATLDRYNSGAAAGVDPEFGKRDPVPIVEVPFYAVRMNLIRHTSAGGLRINAKGQVLEHAALWDRMQEIPLDEHPVIPRLYAGGEAAAFLGYRRAHRKTGPILTMGKIIGEAVAAEERLAPDKRRDHHLPTCATDCSAPVQSNGGFALEERS